MLPRILHENREKAWRNRELEKLVKPEPDAAFLMTLPSVNRRRRGRMSVKFPLRGKILVSLQVFYPIFPHAEV